MIRIKPNINFQILFAALLINSLAYNIVSAQEQIPEIFWMHFDKQFYLTGETAWYTVYNTNHHELQDHSAIVYINFHDKEGSLLDQQKLELVNGLAEGAFNIPVSWQEDYYYISCFTSWNLRFQDQNIFVAKIRVYNSFLAGPINLPENSEEKLQKETISKNIDISLDKTTYSNREKVKLTLASSLKGKCSMSIISLESIEEHTTTSEENLSGGYKSVPVKEKEKQLKLEGLAVDPVTQLPIQSDVLCLYQTGSNQFTRLSSSNSAINTKLPPFHGNVIYQIFNMNPFQTELIDFKLKVYGEKLLNLPSNNESPPRTTAIRKYIKNAQLRTKISEIFTEHNRDSLQGKQLIPISLKADKVYDMSKFQALKTLEDFLREIVLNADLSSDKGVTSVKLKNMETKNYFMDNPWYLVDGYLYRDQEQVMKIPFKNLVRVEIFNTNKSILSQLDPVMIRSGMIAIYTDNFSFKNQVPNQNMVNFQGFATPKKFEGARFISKNEARENPELSPLLYWNGNLQSNNRIEFITSDLQGDFLIEVQGYSEKGQRLFGTQKFTVKY
jgi:hypothetical protein